MTPNTQALQRLLDAVESGTAMNGDFADAFHMKGPSKPYWMGTSAYNNNSLDAAKALHDALLPGWAIERMSWWPGGHWTFHLWGTSDPDHNGDRWHNHTDGRVEASNTDPARAWLLALIRAVMAGER